MDKRVVTKSTANLSESEQRKLYEILLGTFDISFLRTMDSQLLAFRHKDYQVTYVGSQGMCLWWSFKEFAFIEYLLIKEEYRHQGLGRQIINAIKTCNKCIVVEVDIRENVDAFYEKNGFKKCIFFYEPIQINEIPQKELMLMSFDHSLSEDEYKRFINQISEDELQF